jgi:hypothetical protein
MTLSVDVSVRRGAFHVRAAFEAEEGETLALIEQNRIAKGNVLANVPMTEPSFGATE